MRGFAKTLFLLLGTAGILCTTIGVTLVLLLNSSGVLPEKMRAYVLTEEDERYLKQRNTLPDEEPALKPAEVQAEIDKNFRRLADHLNEGTVRELMEQLSQREAELQERGDYLDQREAELRMHQAELARLERHFKERKVELNELLTRLDNERASWAEAKVQEQQQLQVLRQVEREQWTQVAKLYEGMKYPWKLLRELPVIEMATILTLMDQKKAAKILDIATKDPTSRDLPIQIHRELLRLDIDGLSVDQAKRLAGLYNFMRAQQVVSYLAGSPPKEVAQIIEAMDTKKATAVIEALAKTQPDLALEVQRLLQPDGAGGDA